MPSETAGAIPGVRQFINDPDSRFALLEQQKKYVTPRSLPVPMGSYHLEAVHERRM
jgi:hypothetical protein